MSSFADQNTQAKGQPQAASPWSSKPIVRDSMIGAAIGTALFPGLGTAAGAAVGALFGGLFDGPSAKPAPTTEAKKSEEAPKPADEAKPVKAEQKVRDDFAGKSPQETDKIRNQATKTVEASYGKEGGIKALPYKESEPIGDLSKMSPEERLKVISKISQNDPKDPDSKHYCGPTALLAAAMYGGGNEGVNKLITQMKSDAKDDPEQQKRLQSLLEKSQGGGLDLKDIHNLEKDLYADLQKRQIAFLQSGVGGHDEEAEALRKKVAKRVKEEGGTDNKSLQDFIKQSGLSEHFFDKDGNQIMGLNLVANNSKNADPNNKNLKDAAHWVLDINDASAGELVRAQDGHGYNTVYDPWNRGGQGAFKGGQVSTMKDNPELTSAYFDTNPGTGFVNVDRP